MLVRQINFEKGKILLLSNPIFLSPITTLVELQKTLDKNKLSNLLYLAGKTSGTHWFNQMSKNFYSKKITKRDTVVWGNNIIALAGFGVSVLEKFDEEKKEMIFRLENATVSQLYGKSTKPTDNLYRGYAAAAGNLVFKEESEAVEIACKSTGSKVCRFIVKPRSKWDKNDPKFKEQVLI